MWSSCGWDLSLGPSGSYTSILGDWCDYVCRVLDNDTSNAATSEAGVFSVLVVAKVSIIWYKRGTRLIVSREFIILFIYMLEMRQRICFFVLTAGQLMRDRFVVRAARNRIWWPSDIKEAYKKPGDYPQFLVKQHLFLSSHVPVQLQNHLGMSSDHVKHLVLSR